METVFHGIAASDGFATGPVFRFVARSPLDIDSVVSKTPEQEVTAFYLGRKRYRAHLNQLYLAAMARQDELTAEMLDAYREMLDDDEVESEIVAMIRQERVSALKATARVFRRVIAEMEQLENEYASQRIDDMRRLRDDLLAGIAGQEFIAMQEMPEEDGILCGYELTPADTALFPKERLLGIVSETGGVTSHVAILARSLGIPAVVGVQGAMKQLECGKTVLLDGCEGRVVLNPSETTQTIWEEKRKRHQEKMARLMQGIHLPTVTLDGFSVRLLANICNAREAETANQFGADGIGLFRTEFLYMNSDRCPDEDRQYEDYRCLLDAMHGNTVTIRTLDIGGDKPLSYVNFPKEVNPFLGWRACRMYAADPELILSQLRAILRASVHGNVRIMFPMISSCEEASQMLEWVDVAKSQLRSRRITFEEKVPLGIMIETPAAAIMSEELLELFDFGSIGSNDLTQYTLAVDRGNERVASLYDPFHPAVLRLIDQTVRAGRTCGKNVGICGELASHPGAIPFLVGIGMEQLSMTPSAIPVAKSMICKSDSRRLAVLAAEILRLSSASEVRERLNGGETFFQQNPLRAENPLRGENREVF
ncbi:MAG: phosphoenolpyruvate--protein phosphotransferase [Planctomycetaceae bacterium]|nr:phosphoenolpyruvate--protein phosphotransferase [Planctomycetaceae bacterium]